MKRLSVLVAVLTLLCSGTRCFAGAPMGVSLLTVAAPVDGCLHRAARALEWEGYTVSPKGDHFIWGNAGSRHALIICTPAPDDLTQACIVVSLLPPDTVDAAVADAVALKERMEEIARDRDWDRRH